MNYFSLAFKIMKLWPQIQELINVAKPVLATLPHAIAAAKPVVAELKKASPQAKPLIESIWKEISPELGDLKLEEPEDYNVKWLQDALNKLTGSKLAIDGDYGERTREVVKKFQQSHGLEADGWAGIETSAAIYHDLAEKKA